MRPLPVRLRPEHEVVLLTKEPCFSFVEQEFNFPLHWAALGDFRCGGGLRLWRQTCSQWQVCLWAPRAVTAQSAGGLPAPEGCTAAAGETLQNRSYNQKGPEVTQMRTAWPEVLSGSRKATELQPRPGPFSAQPCRWCSCGSPQSTHPDFYWTFFSKLLK